MNLLKYFNTAWGTLTRLFQASLQLNWDIQIIPDKNHWDKKKLLQNFDLIKHS